MTGAGLTGTWDGLCRHCSALETAVHTQRKHLPPALARSFRRTLALAPAPAPAGIVMLQMAVPSMRTDRALRAFNASYGTKYKYDLAAWRKGVNLYPRDCALLDANDGLGAWVRGCG